MTKINTLFVTYPGMGNPVVISTHGTVDAEGTNVEVQ